MIFYRFSDIQIYDKNSFHFKNERLTEILQAVSATFYDCINTTYQFFKPFSDNKTSDFEEYGVLRVNSSFQGIQTRRHLLPGILAGIQRKLKTGALPNVTSITSVCSALKIYQN